VLEGGFGGMGRVLSLPYRQHRFPASPKPALRSSKFKCSRRPPRRPSFDRSYRARVQSILFGAPLLIQRNESIQGKLSARAHMGLHNSEVASSGCAHVP